MSDYDRPISPQPIRDAAKAILSSHKRTFDNLAQAETREARCSSLDEKTSGQSQRDVALATGVKHDQAKEPLSLLSRIWLLGVARVMAFGAKKYAAHNWRGGIERSRLISAALRHILAYNEGEDNDLETGLSHLDHASCCLMFARETHETRPDLDDRYKGSACK